MDRDGRNKVNLSNQSDGFAYGFSGSPMGKRIAYHENYQIYIADADGTHRVRVDTPPSVQLRPTWSPDGKWLLFVSGEHYDCHPHVRPRADRSALKRIASRNGVNRAALPSFLDVPDFHGGSSDVPNLVASMAKAFSIRLKSVKRSSCFEPGSTARTEQLTDSPGDTSHYHPKLSPDGKMARLRFETPRCAKPLRDALRGWSGTSSHPNSTRAGCYACHMATSSPFEAIEASPFSP